MATCKQCGSKINPSDAILLIEGKKKYYFCNEEEKNSFIGKNSDNDIKKKCYQIIFGICDRGIPVVYSRIKELNKKYSWDKIYVALDKVKPSVEKHYKEKYTTDFALARYIETCINNFYQKETEKIEKPKFHIINSKKLAMGISYILDENYYEFDDKFNEGYKCYSFKETDKFIKALETIEKLKEELKNIINQIN